MHKLPCPSLALINNQAWQEITDSQRDPLTSSNGLVLRAFNTSNNGRCPLTFWWCQLLLNKTKSRNYSAPLLSRPVSGWDVQEQYALWKTTMTRRNQHLAFQMYRDHHNINKVIMNQERIFTKSDDWIGSIDKEPLFRLLKLQVYWWYSSTIRISTNEHFPVQFSLTKGSLIGKGLVIGAPTLHTPSVSITSWKTHSVVHWSVWEPWGDSFYNWQRGWENFTTE